jgi:hypothetical protein
MIHDPGDGIGRQLPILAGVDVAIVAPAALLTL